MRLQGDDYSKRLEGYAYETLLLISEGMKQPRNVYQQCRNITSDSELSEEEVVKRLKEVLETQKKLAQYKENFMRLKGEEYDKRLERYSYDTLLLISECMNSPREVLYRSLDITTDSELTEEEVVTRLKELLSKNKK